jgi:excisionase family DNA binding protein
MNSAEQVGILLDYGFNPDVASELVSNGQFVPIRRSTIRWADADAPLGEVAPQPTPISAPRKGERVNIERAGQILGLQPRTVQKMAQRGELPGAARMGRRWTFNEDKLRGYVRHKERETWHAQKHQPDVTGVRTFSGAAPKSKAAKSDGRFTQIIQRLRDSAGKPEGRAQLRIVSTGTRPGCSKK